MDPHHSAIHPNLSAIDPDLSDWLKEGSLSFFKAEYLFLPAVEGE
jgi:hypothetical protein